MTTKNSPINVLRVQSDKIAKTLKQAVGKAERGEQLPAAMAIKIDEARQRGFLKIGVVMDDKTIFLDLPWQIVLKTDEKALSEYVLGLMREEKPNS